MKRLLLVLPLIALVAALAWALQENDTPPATGPGAEQTQDTPAGDNGSAATASAATDGSRRADPAAAAAAGWYSAPVGRQFEFALTSETTTSMTMQLGDANTGQRQNTRTKTSGRLEVTVLDRMGDEMVLAFRCPEAEARDAIEGVTAVDNPERVADLAEATLVRVTADGSFVGYRFADRHGAQSRAFLRGLLESLRFVIGDGAQWEHIELGTMGEVSTRYSLRAVEENAAQRADVTRQRVSAESETDLGMEWKFAGSATATLDRDAGWWTACRVDETITATVPGGSLETTVRTVASVQLEATRQVETLAKVDWSTGWHDLDASSDAAAAGEDIRIAQLRARVGDLSLDDLLGKLSTLLKADPRDDAAVTDAWQRLTAMMIVDPEQLEALTELLPNSDPELAELITSAAGAADTAATQSFLRGLLANGALPAALRQHTVTAMFQLTQPDPASVDAVAALAKDTKGELGRTGLMLLGAMADRTASTELLDQIVAQRSQAESDGALQHWLDAVGNSGRPEAVAAIERYLENQEPDLRAAAVQALRRIDGKTAEAALAKRVHSDSSERIRIMAADLLARRSSPSAFAAVDRILQGNSVDLRRAVLAGLGQQLANPAAQRLLRRAATSDPDASLREFAQGLLPRR